MAEFPDGYANGIAKWMFAYDGANRVRTENEGQASSVGHHPVLRVGIVMGSETDLVWMQQSAEALKKFGVAYEMQIISAHRTPSILAEYGASARTKGIRVIIAGAGGAAHLPGMMAAQTNVPVIGVPCPVGAMRGEDALWSIVQMPKGVPVATVAIGGGWNAGVLAAQIIATGDSLEARAIAEKLAAYKFEMASAVARMNERL